MSFEGYFARFERAVRVNKGRVGETDLVRGDGQSMLRKPPKTSAPVIQVPVALSGVARPGQVITILPGAYSGKPMPVATCKLYRDGVEDKTLSGHEFVVTAADLGYRLKVVETATNSSGSIQSTAEVSVERAAPGGIALSVAAAEVNTEQALPIVLAEMSADGDLPMTWSLGDEAPYLAIEAEAATAVLKLVSMPAPGPYPVRIRAANSAGAAVADFTLSVSLPAIVAPRAVTLSRTSVELTEDAEFPVTLAEIGADGTAPLHWQVSGGGAHVTVETSGPVPVLQLRTMPVLGTHDLILSASNDAGSAEAVFALTLRAAAVAPRAVLLSEVAGEVVSDAALPLVLARLSADGTAPLAWTVSGAAGFDIAEVDGDPVLRLMAMPAEGAHSVSVTASNAAGSAAASFGLTVRAVVPAVAGYSASSGTITVSDPEADGGRTLTITSGDFPGSYRMTAEQLLALETKGHAVMLAAPVITQTGETFAITSPGIYVAPADDPATISHQWLRDGAPSGEIGDSFTRAPVDKYRGGQLSLRISNLAMETAGEAQTRLFDVWQAEALTLEPMHFRAGQVDKVEWNPVFTQDVDKAFLYHRFVYLPEPGDNTRDGAFFFIGPDTVTANLIQVNCNQYGLGAYLNVQNPGGSPINIYGQAPLPASGSVVEVVASFGMPVSPTDARRTVDIRIYINGVLKTTKLATMSAGATVAATGMTKLRLGAKSIAGGESFDLIRAALWMGSTMKVDDALPLLRKADGTPAHPASLGTALGNPIVDFYNSSNHGSLGAPATASDLS